MNAKDVTDLQARMAALEAGAAEAEQRIKNMGAGVVLAHETVNAALGRHAERLAALEAHNAQWQRAQNRWFDKRLADLERHMERETEASEAAHGTRETKPVPASTVISLPRSVVLDVYRTLEVVKQVAEGTALGDDVYIADIALRAQERLDPALEDTPDPAPLAVAVSAPETAPTVPPAAARVETALKALKAVHEDVKRELRDMALAINVSACVQADNLCVGLDVALAGVWEADACEYAAPGPMPKTGPRGLYGKYEITHADGSPVTGDYFVLKLTDPHARTALRAYAAACKKDNPALADDLCSWIEPHGPPAAGPMPEPAPAVMEPATDKGGALAAFGKAMRELAWHARASARHCGPETAERCQQLIDATEMAWAALEQERQS